jgi:class 3 adenylate cyclase/predicted ATPase
MLGEARAAAPVAGSASERRQLTVMFVDMVGSTRLATTLDPEELAEVLKAYQDAVAEAVARFGGQVDHVQGDGVLACFGLPQAHEDDAERAVRAGLATVQAVSRLRVAGAETPACRVGIATGLVVTGDPAVGGGPGRIAGEAPYLPTRLQASGAPGTVIVAEATRQLVGRLFAFEDLGPRSLKGFPTPVQAWRVTGESRVESRFEALRWTSRTPLVGRRQELALLLERWELAREDEGQVVLLSGEAGIGKSRLVRALCDELGREPHTLLSHHCSPYHANSAFHPIAEHLRRAAELTGESSPKRLLSKLEAALALPADRVRDSALLLADLLAIPDTGPAPTIGLSPQRRKEGQFQVLLDHLAGLAARQPVLALYEDMHWADPSTLELVERLIGRVQKLPVLVVITSRPEFAPSWAGHGDTTTLSLGRLARRHGLEMIERVAGGRTIPTEVLEQILTRADGMPLFLEELTRAVLASDLADPKMHGEAKDTLPDVTVPATLKDSLVAQLDRLDVVKQAVQIGAVIGREFSLDLLAMVTATPEEELRLALGRLVEAGLLHRDTTTKREGYAFKHALIRDAAYESLLRSRRRELHAQVAHALERAFPGQVAGEPELLAHHYTEAGLNGLAVPYWHSAGQRAVQRYANAEAIGHLRQAIRLLIGLPAGLERDRTELLLQMDLGAPLMAAKGYAAPEVLQAYDRASELCRCLDDAPTLFPILFGLCVFHLIRPNLSEARPLAVRLLAMAQEAGDDDLMLEACGLAGVAELYAGRLVGAIALLERGFALHRPDRHHEHAARYGQDPLAVLAFVARAHALAGRPKLARQRGEVLLAAARNPEAHPGTLVALQAHLAHLHLVLRDAPTAREHAERQIAVGRQHDLPLWIGLGRMFRGAALIEDGVARRARLQVADGIAEALEGMSGYRATGAGLDVVTCMTSIAAGHAHLGQPGEGLRVLDEASRIIAATGETYYTAEVHRLIGELSLDLENQDPTAAETALSTAMSIAGRQGAKLLERRAAASLVRLWRQQGRLEVARGLFAQLRDEMEAGVKEMDWVGTCRSGWQEGAKSPADVRGIGQ